MSQSYQDAPSGQGLLSGRIAKMMDTINSQNSMIATYQKRSEASRNGVKQIYQAAIKYSDAWERGPAQITDLQYPQLRNQDLMENPEVMLQKLLNAFAVICGALQQTSGELQAAYKQMDIALEDSLAAFRTLQANENRVAKGLPVSGNSSAASQAARPTTPEVPMADRTRSDSAVATPEDTTKPTASDKKQNNRPQGPGQKKTTSATLGNIVGALASGTPSKGSQK